MRNRLFIIKVYLLTLAGFLLMAFAYTFYMKNFKVQTIYVKDFPRIEIRNHLGEYKTIDDYKGKTLLVNFWISSCPYCLDEMKYFPDLLARYDDLAIMSLAVDSARVTEDVLKNKAAPWQFIVTDNPRWTFYNVDRTEKGGYADLLKIKTYPAYFLIDKNGEIISSPRNAIFAVERELSGLFSLRAAYKNYFDEFGAEDFTKAAVLFHLMVSVIFLLLFFKRKYSNQYSPDNHKFSSDKEDANEP
jgi:thiol-disulfide isomerase/thioredoxin